LPPSFSITEASSLALSLWKFIAKGGM
jgi:hypothetical protein